MSTKHQTSNLYKSGMSAFIHKEYDAAINIFSQALEKSPDAYRIWVSRGASHLKTGHIDLALSDLNEAIKISPSYARAYHMRALAFDRDGRTEVALRDLDRAIEIDPEYGAAYQSRASLLSKAGQEDRAIADMQMVTHLTEVKLTEFAEENNILRSQHLKLEADEIVNEFNR